MADNFTSRAVIAERLRTAAYVIDKMRGCVPEDGGCAPNCVIGRFAAEHEAMVRELLMVINPCCTPLTGRIENHHLSPQTDRILICSWAGGKGKG